VDGHASDRARIAAIVAICERFDLTMPPMNPNRALSRLLSVFSLFCGLAAFPVKAGDCSDAFAGASWGPAFDLIDKTTTKTGTATVANGKLTLSAAGRDIYNTVNEYVALRRKGVEGDFDMTITIESQDNIHDWSQAGFVVANDLDNLAQGGYVALDVSPRNGRAFFSDTKGTAGTLDSNFTKGVSGYPVSLRLTKQNKLFSAWYKESSASTWTVLVSNKNAQLTAVNSQIALFSLSHDAERLGKAVFSNFTCTDASASTTLLTSKPRASRFALRREEAIWKRPEMLIGRQFKRGAIGHSPSIEPGNRFD
jgi:hypothetical protein